MSLPQAFRASPVQPEEPPAPLEFGDLITDFMSLFPGLPVAVAEEMATSYMVAGELPADIVGDLQAGNYGAVAEYFSLDPDDAGIPQTTAGESVLEYLRDGGDLPAFDAAAQAAVAGINQGLDPSRAQAEPNLTAPLGPVDRAELAAPPGFEVDPALDPTPISPPAQAAEPITVSREQLPDVFAAVDELNNMVGSPLAEGPRGVAPGSRTATAPMMSERGIPGIDVDNLSDRQSLDAARSVMGLDNPALSPQQRADNVAAFGIDNTALQGLDLAGLAAQSMTAAQAGFPDAAVSPASAGLGSYSRSAQDVEPTVPPARDEVGFLGVDDEGRAIMGVTPDVVAAMDELSGVELSNSVPASASPPASAGLGSYSRASQDVAPEPSLADEMADLSFSPSAAGRSVAGTRSATDVGRVADFSPNTTLGSVDSRVAGFSPDVSFEGLPSAVGNVASFSPPGFGAPLGVSMADVDQARFAELDPFSIGIGIPGMAIGVDEYGALNSSRTGYGANSPLSDQQRADNLAADLGYTTPAARDYLSENAALMGVAPAAIGAMSAPATIGFGDIRGVDFGVPSPVAGISVSADNRAMGVPTARDIAFNVNEPAVDRFAVDGQNYARTTTIDPYAALGVPTETVARGPRGFSIGVPETIYSADPFASRVDDNPVPLSPDIAARGPMGLSIGSVNPNVELDPFKGQWGQDNPYDPYDDGYAQGYARTMSWGEPADRTNVPGTSTGRTLGAPDIVGISPDISGLNAVNALSASPIDNAMASMTASQAAFGPVSSLSDEGLAAAVNGINVGIDVGLGRGVAASPIGYGGMGQDARENARALDAQPSILGGIQMDNRAAIENFSAVPSMSAPSVTGGPRGLSVGVPGAVPDPYSMTAAPSQVQTNLNRDVINPADMNLAPLTSWSDDPGVLGFGSDMANMTPGNLGFDISTGLFGDPYGPPQGTVMGEAVTPDLGMLGANTDPIGFSGFGAMGTRGGAISGLNATDALSASPIGMAAESMSAVQASFGGLSTAGALSDDGLASSVNGLNSGIDAGLGSNTSVSEAGISGAFGGASSGIDAGVGADTGSSSSGDVGSIGASASADGSDAGVGTGSLGGTGLGTDTSNSRGTSETSTASEQSSSGVETGTSAAADAAASAAAGADAGVDAGSSPSDGPSSSDVSSESSTTDEGNDCFLTTACTQSKGLPDDCRELQVLRWYRDSVLAYQPNGYADIVEYYLVAPGLVRKINSRSDASEIWNAAYADISTAVAQITDGDFDGAYATYRELFERLRETANGT